jgi:DNA polymerase-3 subunit alpha
MDGDLDTELKDDDIPFLDPWPMDEMLKYEKELLGFYISGHPLDSFGWESEVFSTQPFDIEHLKKLDDRGKIRLAGLITDFRKLFTKKTQEAMGAFRLEGLGSSIDAVIFPGAFRTFGFNLAEDLPVIVGAEISKEEEVKLMINEVYPLKDAGKHYAEGITLRLKDEQIEPEFLEEIKQLCMAHAGDISLNIAIEYPSAVVTMKPEARFNIKPCQKFIERIEELVGPNCIQVKLIKQTFKRPPEQRSFVKKAG